MTPIRNATPNALRLLVLGPSLALGFSLGCFGGHDTSADRAGSVNVAMKIEPSTPTLSVGQSLQFSVNSPSGNEALWSVLPAKAGTFTSNGLFTASLPGSATVIAVWTKDVRYTASTTLTILAAPPQAVISANLVQASGAQQTVAGSAISIGAVVGEPVPATQSVSANSAITVRHGFNPPIPK